MRTDKQLLRTVAALALILPAFAGGAPATGAVAAPAVKPAAAPITPTAAPSATEVTRLPPENADEAAMRAQLDRVRALNAQLRQEREQLQQQLAKVQAEVTVEDKRLKQVSAASALPQPVVEEGFSRYLLVAVGLAGVALLAAGLMLMRRRKKAAGSA